MNNSFISAMTFAESQVPIVRSREWQSSPFYWLLLRGTKGKGQAATIALCDFLNRSGVGATVSDRYENTFSSTSDVTFRVKLSTKARGSFSFQQVRGEAPYHHLCCLGLRPNEAFLWTIPKDVAMTSSRPQHGEESRVISIKPGERTEYCGFDELIRLAAPYIDPFEAP